MRMPDLRLAHVDGVELELYDSGGSGEPVVFVHGGFTDECYAVIQQPALTDRFRVIHYMRRGWGRSSKDGLPLSMQQQGEDCRAVMRHLSLDRAHLAGLSYGGDILLQFALDFPEAVHSLALMEPGLPSVIAKYPEHGAALAAAAGLFVSGEKEAALDVAFRQIAGREFRASFDAHLPPGWLQRAIDAMDTLFLHDVPALQAWEFSGEPAARIRAPALNVMGAHTRAYFKEIHETVQSWIPHAESAVVPAAGHAMLQDNPEASAELLASFCARHPMEA